MIEWVNDFLSQEEKDRLRREAEAEAEKQRIEWEEQGEIIL